MITLVRRGRCARCGSVLPLSPTGALRRHLRDGRVVRLVGRRCPGVVPALGSVTSGSQARRADPRARARPAA